MLELIRSEIKFLAKKKDKAKNLIWLLKKFLIALDIHVLMKIGSWSLAADSMYNFLNTFFIYLDL